MQAGEVAGRVLPAHLNSLASSVRDEGFVLTATQGWNEWSADRAGDQKVGNTFCPTGFCREGAWRLSSEPGGQ